METFLHPLLHDPACRVRIVSRRGHRAVLAAVDVPAGGVVLRLDGDVVDRPSRYSVQLGADRHLDVHEGVDPDAEPARYAWRFLNHSCEPNGVLHERLLIAPRAIRRGDEVTFDYETNEWDMHEPFACCCGAASCRGAVRGYRHLPPAARRALAGLAAPHLLQLADGTA